MFLDNTSNIQPSYHSILHSQLANLVPEVYPAVMRTAVRKWIVFVNLFSLLVELCHRYSSLRSSQVLKASKTLPSHTLHHNTVPYEPPPYPLLFLFSFSIPLFNFLASLSPIPFS